MSLRLEKSVFIFISLGFVLTAGNDLKDEDDREAHSGKQGLWFGPRLGKRALQISDEDNRDIYLRLLEAADAMKYYYDQLPVSLLERSDPDTRVTKKVIFTPKLGRREEPVHHFVEFTPRLGKRITEELAARPTDQEIYRPDEGIRTRYFSPRLGRTMNFSPRLGRELSYSDLPASIRVARSVNNTKSSKE